MTLHGDKIMTEPNKRTIHPPKDGWEKQTYYIAEVSWSDQNPIYRAIFRCGFLTKDGEPSGYSGIMGLDMEDAGDYADLRYLKIIKRLFSAEEEGYNTAPRPLPAEAEAKEQEIEMQIKLEDCKVLAGNTQEGGQRVGVSSVVKVTHLPTGMVAQCDQHRSQMQNRAACLKMLQAGLGTLKLSS